MLPWHLLSQSQPSVQCKQQAPPLGLAARRRGKLTHWHATHTKRVKVRREHKLVGRPWRRDWRRERLPQPQEFVERERQHVAPHKEV